MSIGLLKSKKRKTRLTAKSEIRPKKARPRLASDVQQRIRKLLGREIDFVPNRGFRHATAEIRIVGQPLEAERTTPAGKLPRDLPAHLARLCESELLTAAAERDLFRRMNYLKFRANALAHAVESRPAERQDAAGGGAVPGRGGGSSRSHHPG